MSDQHEEHHFGDGEPFTIGLEEELFLVDAADGHLVNTGAEVIEQLGELPRGDIKNELHRSQIELITGVCTTVAEAVEELCELRRAVLATGAGIVACGTHPTAVEGDSQFTDKPRYERIHELLGDAGATPVCALHIHVGMPDADTAIRVFNGLRRHVPLLEALGANSPYRHGRDTGLASARSLTLRSWPRAGVPRAMDDLDDFLDSTARLSHVAEVPDYTFHWWKLRPHPRIGTVEIRALDTQLSPRHTAALAAAVQALALHESRARAGRGTAGGDPRRGVVPGLAGRGRGDAARRGQLPAAGARRCSSAWSRRSAPPPLSSAAPRSSTTSPSCSPTAAARRSSAAPAVAATTRSRACSTRSSRAPSPPARGRSATQRDRPPRGGAVALAVARDHGDADLHRAPRAQRCGERARARAESASRTARPAVEGRTVRSRGGDLDARDRCRCACGARLAAAAHEHDERAAAAQRALHGRAAQA